MENNTFYPKNDMRNYLCHHGVKGMHWGIRHDESLTGKKKRKSSKMTPESIMWKIPYKDWQNNKRIVSSAVLGLEALKKTYSDIQDSHDKGEQEWFLFEDQTYFLPQIADLVNQGYSKNEIISNLNKMYDKTQNVIEKYEASGNNDAINKYYDSDPTVFAIREAWDPWVRSKKERFIDDCIEAAKILK